MFISYAHADEQWVRQLSQALEAAHVYVHTMTTEVRPGDDWRPFAADAFDKVAAVLFIISKSSVSSRWVAYEAGAAISMFGKRGAPLAIPIVVDDVPIPDWIADVQAIFAQGQTLDYVVTEVLSALGAQSGRVEARNQERRETQAKIESNLATYVQPTVDKLLARGQRFALLATISYASVGLILIVGLTYVAICGSLRGSSLVTWEAVAKSTITSILVIGLLWAIARFAFVLGRSFMVESLRNEDRIHAISFGQFYLRAFGDKADWPEMKEAFKYWNIDIGSSFLQQSAADIDSPVLQAIARIAGRAK
ncbi:MAG: toll/interleukin-1 receptor domain-containing protein [Candidatus Cybelea sp.]